MGPPKCPDCPHDRFVAELASPGMQERWAERVDIQWSWGRDGCAWFHLCQKCHLAEWPLNFRTNNASNRPGGVWQWHGRSGGGRPVGQLVDGRTFYLTQPVPETTVKLYRGEPLPRKRAKLTAAGDSGAQPSGVHPVTSLVPLPGASATRSSASASAAAASVASTSTEQL